MSTDQTRRTPPDSDAVVAIDQITWHEHQVFEAELCTDRHCTRATTDDDARRRQKEEQ